VGFGESIAHVVTEPVCECYMTAPITKEYFSLHLIHTATGKIIETTTEAVLTADLDLLFKQQCVSIRHSAEIVQAGYSPKR